MRLLGIPSGSSKFHAAAIDVLRRGLGDCAWPTSNTLSQEINGLKFVGARGRDLPRLVSLELVGAALTGQDAYLEARLAGHELAAWNIDSIRPSRLCLMAAKFREPSSFECIVSEYPGITAAWFASQSLVTRPTVIPMRGSIEGLVSSHRDVAGVATVVTGSTMRANGLILCDTILTSDMCLVTRPGDSYWVERLKNLLVGVTCVPGWVHNRDESLPE